MTLRHTTFLWVLALLALSGCHERERATLDRAFSLVDDHPDSVLTLLDGIDRYTLSAADEARYALVYTIAQNKTGLDVADDSLMRIAYNYNPLPSMSLPADTYTLIIVLDNAVYFRVFDV